MRFMNKFFSIILLLTFCIYGEISAGHSLEGKVITSEQHSYELHNYLSGGGFGAVFRATDENGQEVAIKVFERADGFNSDYMTKSWPWPTKTWEYSSSKHPSPPISHSPPKHNDHKTNLYTIEREWEIGCVFDHPNIIKAYDRGIIPAEYEDEDSVPFLVLEFVSGVTFFEVKDGQYSRDDASALALQLIDALKYGLSFKMYYNDLHAGNVMLSKDNTLKIIDLGSYQSFQSMLRSPLDEAYMNLQWTYLLVKKILRKGGYEKEETALITEQMKDIIKNMPDDEYDELSSVEFYEKVLEEWIHILHSIRG